jgi:hypothetical protein
MQSDRYLRVVLTVIAVCLVWICARDVALVKTATASNSVMDVNIAELGGLEVFKSQGLPVSVK